MKIKIKHLRKIIKEQLILEKAKSVEDSSNVGLYRNNDGYYILVDIENIKKLDPNLMKDDGDDFIPKVKDDITESIIIGMMRVNDDYKTKNKQWNSASVKIAAAKKGWGPLLYDVVMSLEGGLTADRGENLVSPDAQKVWAYYFNNRKDVKHKLLDDEHNPKTKPTKDDTSGLHDGGKKNPINYAYTTNKKGLASTLEKNYLKVKNIIDDNKIDIVMHAKNFFSIYYSKMYFIK